MVLAGSFSADAALAAFKKFQQSYTPGQSGGDQQTENKTKDQGEGSDAQRDGDHEVDHAAYHDEEAEEVPAHANMSGAHAVVSIAPQFTPPGVPQATTEHLMLIPQLSLCRP